MTDGRLRAATAVSWVALLATVACGRLGHAQEVGRVGEFGPVGTDLAALLATDLDENEARALFERVSRQLLSAGDGRFSERDRWLGAVAGVVAAYDTLGRGHEGSGGGASLLDRQGAAAVLRAMGGEMVGLGVEVQPDAAAEGLRIVRVVRGGPADRAGLRAGDLIHSIDRRAIAGRALGAVLDSLQGEAGSHVLLGFVRTSAEGVLRLQADLARESFRVRSVTEALLPDGTGVVRIERFNETTPAELQASLQRLADQGVERLVLDLRGNAGGDLRAAVRVAGTLGCGEGAGLRLRVPGQPEWTLRAETAAAWDGAIAVIVNQWTRGSAEALVTLLREERGAVVSGEPTAGERRAEWWWPDPSGVVLRIEAVTVSTLGGASWAGEGVMPDQLVSVEGPMVFGLPPSLGLDPQLDSAVHMLDVAFLGAP